MLVVKEFNYLHFLKIKLEKLLVDFKTENTEVVLLRQILIYIFNDSKVSLISLKKSEKSDVTCKSETKKKSTQYIF